MSTNHNLIDRSKILRITALAILTSIVANLLVRTIVYAIFDLPTDFPPLMPGAIAVLTTIGVGMAGIAFATTTRMARNPIKTYRLIAIVALVVSILPNLSLMANPAAAPFPGGSALAFGTLIVFHFVAAIISVWLLTTQTRR